jgi:hypothetical protein
MTKVTPRLRLRPRITKDPDEDVPSISSSSLPPGDSLHIHVSGLVCPGFQLGLDHWLTCDPSDLVMAIETYFSHVLARRRDDTQFNTNSGMKTIPLYPFTHSGLVNHLGLLNKGELVTLQKSDPVRHRLMSRAFMIIEQDIVEGTMRGEFAPKMSSMYLTQCLSWLDTEHRDKGPREVKASGLIIQYVEVKDDKDLDKLNASQAPLDVLALSSSSSGEQR